MASTDFNGKPILILGEGSQYTFVVGDRSYKGTLMLRVDGTRENWYLKLDAMEPGEPDEIQIHKVG